MSYHKPEIAVLGSPIRVIETQSKDGDGFDFYTASTGLYGNVLAPPPSYDLDE